MKTCRWTRRKSICAFLLVLMIVVLGPYLFSRMVSPGNRVAVFSDNRSEAAKNDRASIRVACYNIAHGRGLADSNWAGGDKQQRIMRLEKIADLLKEIDADVIVLNEVDFGCSWSHSINQAEFIASLAGYPYRVEERNLDFVLLAWEWRFGNAVLSKYPLNGPNVIDLPCYSAWEDFLAGKKRGVRCEVRSDRGSFLIVGAHLSHRSESIRVKSAAAINQLVAGSKLPTVVAGDLNSTPPGFPGSKTGSGGINALQTFYKSGQFQQLPESVSSESDFTFRSDKPESVIDWLLIPHEVRVANYTVVKSQLSDHRPVFADLLFKSVQTAE